MTEYSSTAAQISRRAGVAAASSGAAALLVESARSCGSRRLRRAPRPSHLHRLAQLLEDPLGRELAVAQLRAFVLRDRPHDRPELRSSTRRRSASAQAGRRLDVEERLDARRALLRVLAARAARPREAERDLRPNRLDVHGGHSPGRRRRAARLGRADRRGGRRGRRLREAGHRLRFVTNSTTLVARAARRAASADGLRAREDELQTTGRRRRARAARASACSHSRCPGSSTTSRACSWSG